ncbi:hypothetical protein [Candidatus Nitrotoga sp. M5]|uniref:hypothetical protein n=1 Tax=Candidatus Nitrotoga sp. M5 TaxID=2890409 RepID=UPI001EF66B93|nr:hypothetical protein [Candidatus Nitrotoga sp. M5]CAH1387989.1 hypothetical protein NTGM5_760019 [Candidatus Nitrotoga sp. M5]
MCEFDSLILALEKWFDKPLSAIPREAQERIERDFRPMPWDAWSPDQRRSVAAQWDYRHDPATELERQYWWDLFCRKDALENQIREWEKAATPTASDLAQKETRLNELRKELGRMEQLGRQVQSHHIPEQVNIDGLTGGPAATGAASFQYVAYPKAMKLLADRLNAIPEELAAWIFYGTEHGGISAYTNANELSPPPKFFYGYHTGTEDYIAPLMACWFREEDVLNFQPDERYITGNALIERWSKQRGIKPIAFIRAKIAESRLMDMHPIFGGTEAIFSEMGSFPPLETGLFAMSYVRAIEAEDFEVVLPDVLNENAPSRAPKPLIENATNFGNDEKPWLIQNPDDPDPKYPWFTPARFFARALIKEDVTLLTKRDILARKVADALKKVGLMKRGGKKPFDPATVKKALSNVVLG